MFLDFVAEFDLALTNFVPSGIPLIWRFESAAFGDCVLMGCPSPDCSRPALSLFGTAFGLRGLAV